MAIHQSLVLFTRAPAPTAQVSPPACSGNHEAANGKLNQCTKDMFAHLPVPSKPLEPLSQSWPTGIRRWSLHTCPPPATITITAAMSRGSATFPRSATTPTRARGLGLRVKGLGVRVKGLGCRVKGLGFRVKGLGFRVKGRGPRGLLPRGLGAPLPPGPLPRGMGASKGLGASSRGGGPERLKVKGDGL